MEPRYRGRAEVDWEAFCKRFIFNIVCKDGVISNVSLLKLAEESDYFRKRINSDSSLDFPDRNCEIINPIIDVIEQSLNGILKRHRTG